MQGNSSNGGPSSGPDMSQEKLLEQELELYAEHTEPVPPPSKDQEAEMPVIPSPPLSIKDSPKQEKSTPEIESSQQPVLQSAW